MEQAVATPNAPPPSTPITPAAPAISVTPVTTPSPATMDYTKFIGADGKFKEGWKDALLDEDLRGEKFYDAWGTDIKSLLKVAGNQARVIGKYANTKGVLPINENSSDFEKQAFREAMGVPKDAAGYKYTVPEDISIEDLSPEFMGKTLVGFNEANMTQGQVDKVINLYADHLRTVEAAVTAELNQQTKDAIARIQTEWGDKFDARFDLAKRFITKMTDTWPPEKYEELFGKEITIESGATDREGGINEPEFAPLRPLLLDLFANIEEKYGIPDSAAMGEGVGGGAKNLEQQLEELEKIPGFMDGKLRISFDEKDRAKHEEIMKKRTELVRRIIEAEGKTKINR